MKPDTTTSKTATWAATVTMKSYLEFQVPVQPTLTARFREACVNSGTQTTLCYSGQTTRIYEEMFDHCYRFTHRVVSAVNP